MSWRNVSRDEAEAALFFHEKRDEFLAMEHAGLQTVVAQWGPRRKTMLAKFEAGTLNALKMEAFYAALDAGMAKWARPKEVPERAKDDLDVALDYMYNEKEGA